MNKTNIRIQQFELTNFKNTKNGVVSFPSYIDKNYYSKKSDVLGIYGQNGSGKTAFVDGMWIIQHALSGTELPKTCSDYIYHNTDSSKLDLTLSVEMDNQSYILLYELKLKQNKDNRIYVDEEILSFKKLIDGKWTTKANIINYKSQNTIPIFAPKKNLRYITSAYSEGIIDLNVSKKLSIKEGTSFIFRNETLGVISRSNNFNEFSKLIHAIKDYSNENLFIVRNNHSGFINMNLFLPLKFKISENDNITHGELAVGLLKPTIVPEHVFCTLNKILNQMNIVLVTIIPGLKIDIKNYGNQLKEDGAEGIRIELVSSKDNKQIPLKYESDGIKKIISVLSILIIMYNNPSSCVIIDEFDAGIFEFLLGELLEILSNSAKGQLAFTSHNLRPLEMLDTNSILFTTTNEFNRYIRFPNIKKNNNLRSVYYRSISLGGQKENIYELTNKYEINRAFRLAGRNNNEC